MEGLDLQCGSRGYDTRGRNPSQVVVCGEQDKWWVCGRGSGMAWKRSWRRWQRWACLGAAVVVSAWLLLAAPCALLACPPRDPAEAAAATHQPHRDRDAALLVCSTLSFTTTDHQQRQTQGSPQLDKDSPYNVLYEWLPASRSFGANESVTYTTHTTPEMITHVGELATRWSGPLSVAVFVPYTDFCLAAARVAYLRACGPVEVREQVSWHFFWPHDSPPAADWHLIVDEKTCDCNAEETTASIRTFRTEEVLPYPVNVARNVARTAASTWYVLPSDVELYPSEGLAQQFLAMISRMTEGLEVRAAHVSPRVYVVPVFEVGSSVPATKEELLQQYHRHDAVYFHRHVCAHCQRFPAIAEWVTQPGTPGTIKTFSVVKREFPYHRWEPIYICTKQEPLYDERLSWEGLQDKMTQMHELCLQEYNLVILDRAFLVHAPGIKRRGKSKTKDETWREPFVIKNSKIYDQIMEEMQKKYGHSEKCRRH
ncbi:beta-1,4-glucuronyltransferase 1-like isoform X1 [Portunus trituberculatus]|uniref:beta-1,4-glucuronyltransferase 1-like isoform X1 n=1 Tax=Portunus trituberculatus TaxID=210409 RepID=UPI001E1CFF50|nr:beta-1,4-glucuronyltransferase 1-like isoform X1 [Portunus trituberculatus]